MPAVIQFGIAFHVLGVLVWVSALFAMARTVGYCSRQVLEGTALSSLGTHARRTGVFADAGATVALLAGLHVMFAGKYYASGATWLWIKLVLVVAVLVVHVFLRREAKRTSRGEKPSTAPIQALLWLLVSAIALLAVLKPFG